MGHLGSEEPLGRLLAWIKSWIFFFFLKKNKLKKEMENWQTSWYLSWGRKKKENDMQNVYYI